MLVWCVGPEFGLTQPIFKPNMNEDYCMCFECDSYINVVVNPWRIVMGWFTSWNVMFRNEWDNFSAYGH